LALHQLRGGNDENIITPALTTALEEKWDIEHNDRLAPCTSKSKKALFAGFHHRVNDAFEPREGRGIGEDALTKKRAINPARCRANAGKRHRDRFDGTTARRQQPMNLTIGVEQRDTEALQRRRRGALSHAD
jgi:hypothetical protein